MLRLCEHKIIAVLISAVEALLLEYDRTALSAFKIPIPCHADSFCNIYLDSEIVHRLRRSSRIVRDEIDMCLGYCIQAEDQTLRVLIKSPNIPLGGKCILFRGDFRQILPVVPRGSQGMIVFMYFQSSPLYQCIDFLNLSQNTT